MISELLRRVEPLEQRQRTSDDWAGLDLIHLGEESVQGLGPVLQTSAPPRLHKDDVPFCVLDHPVAIAFPHVA